MGMENHHLLNRQFKTVCCNRGFPISHLPEGKQLEEFCAVPPYVSGSSWTFPYSCCPPTFCHYELVLISSVFLLTGNTSSAPCSSGLSTTLTFGKGICKRRAGQGITAPGLPSLRRHLSGCSPTLGWFLLPSLGPGARAPRNPGESCCSP